MLKLILPLIFGLISVMTFAQTDSTIVTEEAYVAPRFPGCEDRDLNDRFKYLCSQKRFVSYLEKIIKYPKTASQNGIKGKVIVSFVVKEDGSIVEPRITRDPGDELGNTVLSAVREMQSENELIWRPAHLGGQVVESTVEVPVEFALGYKSLKAKKPDTYILIPDIMPSRALNGAMPDEMTTKAEEKIYEESEIEFAAYFKGCSEDMSLLERYNCSRENYFKYIKDQIQYPESAKSLRIQGIARVGAVIEKDGTLSDIKLIRDPGTGLGEEALRIVTAMKDSTNLWTPGKVGGEPVRSTIDLPIRFVLKATDVAPLMVITDKKKNVLYDCSRLSDLSILEGIEGVKIKEIKEKKARSEYAEKGRYGAYSVRLPKGTGKLPGTMKRLEEVESYEMYYKGLILTQNDEEVTLDFDEISSDGQLILHSLKGRTIHSIDLEKGNDVNISLDTSEIRSGVYLISILQNDLRHSKIIKI